MNAPMKDKSSPIETKHTADDAFAVILGHNMKYLRSWEPVAFEGEDIEGVHQVRVAFRRLRSALTVYRKAIPRVITDPIGQEMRWAASALGPARDLDVFIDEYLNVVKGRIPLPEGEEKMHQVAREHRASAYEQVRAIIKSDRYKRFMEHFDQWVEKRAWRAGDLEEKQEKILHRSATEYAIKVLNKRVTRVLQDGEHLETMTPEERHLLRIDCKKLRYATEFFSPLFNEQAMADFTARLKGLQGVLGTMNDMAVMPRLLHTLEEGREGDTQLAEYAGALVGYRVRQFEEEWKNLNQLWDAFASGQTHPWLKKR